MITISVDLFIIICAFAFIGLVCVVGVCVMVLIILNSDRTGKSNILIERESGEEASKKQ